MAISSKNTIPISQARARLTELCAQVQRAHGEKILTKKGESCAALIDIERLNYYHRLEQEHVHLILFDGAIKGIEDANAGRVIGIDRFKAKYGR
jgi:prevent-host-death family protein